MTNFSLTSHILNEKLQSNILFNEILNEPTGFFKVFQCGSYALDRTTKSVNVHSVYGDIDKIIKHAADVIDNLFYGKLNRINYNVLADSPQVIDINNEIYDDIPYNRIPVKKLFEINAAYKKEIELYLQKIKNLTNRPDGNLFRVFLSKSTARSEIMDIANITDSNFKKYTFTDIKQKFGGSLPDKTALAFYFTEDRKLLAVSDDTFILSTNPLHPYADNMTLNYGSNCKLKSLEHVKEVTNNRDNFIYPNSLIIKDRYGNELEWPIIIQYYSGWNTKGEFGVSWIRDLNINDVIASSYGYKKAKKIGNLSSAASNIRKQVNWGRSKHDYIIVYIPQQQGAGQVSFTDSIIKRHKIDRNEAFAKSSTQLQYKWQKDVLYQLVPFRIGSTAQYVTYFDEAELKYKTETITSSYGNNYKHPWASKSSTDNICYFVRNSDNYSNICRENNNMRYKVLTELCKNSKIIDEIMSNITQRQNVIKEYIKVLNEYTSKVRKCLKSGVLDSDSKELCRRLLFGNDIILGNVTSDTRDGYLDEYSSIQGLINILITTMIKTEQLLDDTLKQKSGILSYVRNNKNTIGVDVRPNRAGEQALNAIRSIIRDIEVIQSKIDTEDIERRLNFLIKMLDDVLAQYNLE